MQGRRARLPLPLFAALALASVPLRAAPACVPVPHVDDRCEEWVAVYDHPDGHAYGPNVYTGMDEPADVVTSRDGTRLFVTGTSYDNRSQLDFATLAYDAATGTRLWEARWNGAGARNDMPAAAAVTRDGQRVFVTGLTQDDVTSNDFGTVGYDARTGRQLWAAQYSSPGAHDDRVQDVVTSPDGRLVFVGGTLRRASEGQDYGLVAYDALSGAPVWDAVYDYPHEEGVSDADRAVALAVDEQRVYLVGTSSRRQVKVPMSLRIDDIYLTVAFDARTGARSWTSEYHGGSGLDVPTAATVSPDGSTVVLNGVSVPDDATRAGYGVLALDAGSGAHKWVRVHQGEGLYAVAGGVAVSPDSRHVYVTGGLQNATYSAYEYATVAYDLTTGEQRWATRYGMDRSGMVQGRDIAVSPDGSRVYVAGYDHLPYRNLTYVALLKDAVTLAYDAGTGAQAWVARFNTDPTQTDVARAEALTVTPDGKRVVAVGLSRHSYELNERHLVTPFELSNASDIYTVSYPA